MLGEAISNQRPSSTPFFNYNFLVVDLLLDLSFIQLYYLVNTQLKRNSFLFSILGDSFYSNLSSKDHIIGLSKQDSKKVGFLRIFQNSSIHSCSLLFILVLIISVRSMTQKYWEVHSSISPLDEVYCFSLYKHFVLTNSNSILF